MDYQEIQEFFNTLDYSDLPSCTVDMFDWTFAQSQLVDELRDAFNILKFEMTDEEDTEGMLGRFTDELFNLDGGWVYQG